MGAAQIRELLGDPKWRLFNYRKRGLVDKDFGSTSGTGHDASFTRIEALEILLVDTLDRCGQKPDQIRKTISANLEKVSHGEIQMITIDHFEDTSAGKPSFVISASTSIGLDDIWERIDEVFE